MVPSEPRRKSGFICVVILSGVVKVSGFLIPEIVQSNLIPLVAMNSSYSISVVIVFLIIFGIPLLCIGFGLACLLSKASGGKLFLGIGIGILCFYAVVAAGYMMMIGAGRSGIVAQGTSPNGKEYCIVQTYKGWTEPYQVSFYIRDASGIWRWNYLAHQDTVWSSAAVTFSNGVAHVSRDGHAYRDISLPTDTVDLMKIKPGYRDHYCPSNFTAEDILSFHNKKFRDD